MKNPTAYSIERRSRKLGYLMLIPLTCIVLLVSVYPLFYGIYLSFRNQNFLKPDNNDFIGLANFVKLLTDKNFVGSVGYTLYYTIGVVIFSYVLGMIIAVMLNRDIPCRGILRALVLIPWVIPSSVATTNWKWLLDSQVGFVNTFLVGAGIIPKSIAFLANPKYVKNVMIVFGVWKSFPFMALTLLSGIQGISGDIYESAKIDGANAWQSFCRITLPLLRPVSFVALTLQCIWTFNSFENIYLFTEGGPRRYTTTISIFTYKSAFFSNEISYACASGTFMMLFMAIFGILYLKFVTEDATSSVGKKALK